MKEESFWSYFVLALDLLFIVSVLGFILGVDLALVHPSSSVKISEEIHRRSPVLVKEEEPEETDFSIPDDISDMIEFLQSAEIEHGASIYPKYIPEEEKWYIIWDYSDSEKFSGSWFIVRDYESIPFS